MEHRTETEITAKSKFSKLDWPTPSMLVSAHRARGQALRDMVTSLAKLTAQTITWIRSADYTSHGRQFDRR